MNTTWIYFQLDFITETTFKKKIDKRIIEKPGRKTKNYVWNIMKTLNPDDNIEYKRCRNEYNHKLRRENKGLLQQT